MFFSYLGFIYLGNKVRDFPKLIKVFDSNQRAQKSVRKRHLYKDYSLNKVVIKAKARKSLYLSSLLKKYIIKEEEIQKKINRDYLVSRNFITILINKYWQEVIFVSTANSMTDKYINLLKSEGLDIYNTQQREFTLNFGKALILGRIESSYMHSSSDLEANKRSIHHIKYIWRKGFNIPISRFVGKYNKLRSKNSSGSVKFIKNLKKYGLPLFGVANNFNQLVVAEPPEILLAKKNWLDSFYSWLLSYSDNDSFCQPAYQGLFFVNPYDALEYKEYISNKHLSLNFRDSLKIFSSRLDLYNKLVQNTSSKIHFRLVPDLRELSLMMYKYRYYKNISFHNNQLWGNNFFQGQPIYLINTIKTKNKETKKIDTIQYTYSTNNANSSKRYKAVFTNYETALTAWKKFKDQSTLYSLPDRPKITVYNLESFLNDLYSKGNDNETENYIFIPAQDSYQFIKAQTKSDLSTNILDKILKKLIPAQIIVKKVMWSLTSRQPINW